MFSVFDSWGKYLCVSQLSIQPSFAAIYSRLRWLVVIELGCRHGLGVIVTGLCGFCSRLRLLIWLLLWVAFVFQSGLGLSLWVRPFRFQSLQTVFHRFLCAWSVLQVVFIHLLQSEPIFISSYLHNNDKNLRAFDSFIENLLVQFK